MFRLFFCYCLLKDTASFDFVSQELTKISIPQEKSPLASRQTWGHRLYSAEAVCFPNFQPENIKKPKRRFGKITRRFRRIKRRFILLKRRFFQGFFMQKSPQNRGFIRHDLIIDKIKTCIFLNETLPNQK